MKKHGKKYTQAKEKISEIKQSKSEAIKTCQEVASAKHIKRLINFALVD